MRERFILTFLFHLVALSMVIFPNAIKGPVIMIISSIPIRVLDVVAFVLIVCGSIYLYYTLFKFLAQEQKSSNTKEKDQQDKTINS